MGSAAAVRRRGVEEWHARQREDDYSGRARDEAAPKDGQQSEECRDYHPNVDVHQERQDSHSHHEIDDADVHAKKDVTRWTAMMKLQTLFSLVYF